MAYQRLKEKYVQLIGPPDPRLVRPPQCLEKALHRVAFFRVWGGRTKRGSGGPVTASMQVCCKYVQVYCTSKPNCNASLSLNVLYSDTQTGHRQHSVSSTTLLLAATR